MIWIDASAGVAGDMLLGALLDAGASLAAVQDAVDTVVPGAVTVTTETVQRAGFRALKAHVTSRAETIDRTWRDIEALLGGAPLVDGVRSRALAVFERLATAEAHVHGQRPDQVHFHEVGALDAIADVVGTCAALADLGEPRVWAGPLTLGTGTVATRHGVLPVPVPAVLELSRGWDVTPGGTGEVSTPTGVALVTTLAEPSTQVPPMRIAAIGVGAGTRDDAARANVVRVVVGDGDAAPATSTQLVIEANVDDLDPRLWPDVLAALLDAGAADAWLTPIIMKKGRPAHTVHALADPALATAIQNVITGHTSTFGMRVSAVTKLAWARDWITIDVDGQAVRVKIAYAAGRIVRATPEFEDVRRAAATLGAAPLDVLDRARQAASSRGLRAGASAPPAPNQDPPAAHRAD